MDWNYFKYIDAIALTGNLTRAAKVLKVDVSTLSRQVQKIETEIKIKIFKRSGKHFVVTPGGKNWIQSAQAIRKTIDDLQFIQGTKVPALVVTSLDIFLNHFLLPKISCFSSNIEWVGTDRNLDLSRREADVAIRFERPTSGDYLVQKLLQVDHAIYAGKQFRKQLSNDVLKSRWVTLSDDFDAIADQAWCRENITELSVQYKVSSCEQISTLLKHAPLLGILPTYMGDRQTELVRFNPQEIIFKRTAWLVIHREVADQKHVRTFIEELHQLIIDISAAHKKS